jgi:hypothetical protein
MTITQEVARLEVMPMRDLKERYTEVFGEPCRSGNRRHLVRRIAWRLQAIREGGLTQRALARAAELADDADLRVRPPKGAIPPTPTSDTPVRTGRADVAPISSRDPRLPKAGTVLKRSYKGRALVVKVLEAGFEFEGERYRSLTAVARKVTGSGWNGMHFFGLTTPTTEGKP